MTHPVVTRLGIKQFWHNHWYTDTTRAATLQQDKTLKLLINIYLNYGLTTQSSPFIHEYWYKPSYIRLRLQEATDYNKSFRRFYYTNDTLGIEHSYLIRNKTPEYFPLKVWLFRYQNWFIVSVKWFKPLKTKKKRYQGLGPSYITGTTRTFRQNPLTRRLKLLSILTHSRYKLETLNSYQF